MNSTPPEQYAEFDVRISYRFLSSTAPCSRPRERPRRTTPTAEYLAMRQRLGLGYVSPSQLANWGQETPMIVATCTGRIRDVVFTPVRWRRASGTSHVRARHAPIRWLAMARVLCFVRDMVDLRNGCSVSSWTGPKRSCAESSALREHARALDLNVANIEIIREPQTQPHMVFTLQPQD